MKSLKLTTVCLGLVFLVTTVAAADAGWLEKPKKQQRTDKTEEEMKPHEVDYLPTMSFVGGVLSRDAHTGWKVGETSLYLAKDCVITMAGEEEGYLEEGREATVMGVKMGNAISAWSIVVSQPSYMSLGQSSSPELKEAGPNPNVGKIVRPVE